MKDPQTRPANPLLEGFSESFFTCADGTRLRYLRGGDGGIPLIMVPAFDCPADVYSLNAPELARDRTVYVLEQRGHGYSDAPAHGRTVHRLAADLQEFIHFINAPSVHLLGWSMGASILWVYIELFGQEKIAKLVFVDQPPMIIADPYETTQERRQHAGQHIDVWHVRKVYRRDFEAGWPILESYWDKPDLPLTDKIIRSIPGDYARKIAMIPPYPYVDKEHREFLADLVRDHILTDYRGVFPLIEKPVLLLTGDAAHATTIESNEWMTDTIRDCIWVRFSAEEFGGHSLCQTAYQKFNLTVTKFLA